jgi:hypothetical protein
MADVIRELQQHPIYIQAQQAKVDVEDLVRVHWNDLEGYTLRTAVTYAIGHLTEEINSAHDAALKGLVVGQRDVYGTRIPLTYPLIQSDGQHKRLVASESTQIEVPSAVVEVKGSFKPEFKNYQITSRISVSPQSVEETIKKLLSVAKTIPAIDFARLEKYGVLVVTGTIRGVYPAARFQDGTKVGSHPVWLATEDTAPQRCVPVIDLSLDREGGSLGVTVSLTRQKYGCPPYEVADLEMICQRAASMNSDPQTQATLVKNGLAGRRIVAVGEIGYLKSRDQGDLVILNAYAVYEYDPRMVGDARLPTEAPAAPPQPPVQTPPPAPAQPAPVPPGTSFLPPQGTRAWGEPPEPAQARRARPAAALERPDRGPDPADRDGARRRAREHDARAGQVVGRDPGGRARREHRGRPLVHPEHRRGRARRGARLRWRPRRSARSAAARRSSSP